MKPSVRLPLPWSLPELHARWWQANGDDARSMAADADLPLPDAFETTPPRTILRPDGDDPRLHGTDGNDWLITAGAREVISGSGADLIDFRMGSGVVTVLDFEMGVDALRLVTVIGGAGGGWHVDAALGTIDLGHGDVLRLMADGAPVDLSSLDPRDLLIHQTILQEPSVVQRPSVPLDLTGGSGADHLRGGLAADRLNGGAGNDLIDAGPGTDRIWTGDGADGVVFRAQTGLTVVYDFDPTQDSVLIQGTTAPQVVRYGTQDTELRLDGARLVLRNTDPDQIVPTLRDAQSGAQTGTAGQDWLRGSADADSFVLRGGTDRLWGGDGADLFLLSPGMGLNVIYDFQVGTDRLGLDGFAPGDVALQRYGADDLELRVPGSPDRLVMRDVWDPDLTWADLGIIA